MNPARLFVGNLPYQTMENDLQEYFSQAGVVTSVNLMLDKFTGKSRGFAFVELSSAEEAHRAIEMFQGKEFQGRPLTVNIARPREDRPARPSSGYRGGARDGSRDAGRRERY
ncbi:MAG: RNA-binding protein [Verrucomicrobiota bacterium]|jgi:cold-inducible RNA-binding protein